MSMKCPTCHRPAFCIDSRLSGETNTRRRYRCSWNKKHLWSTLEFVVRKGNAKHTPLQPALEAELFKTVRADLLRKVMAALGDPASPAASDGKSTKE